MTFGREVFLASLLGFGRNVSLMEQLKSEVIQGRSQNVIRIEK